EETTRHKSSSTDAELGEHFEGDMLLSSSQQRAIKYANIERNGLRNNSKRWPNRTVVYHIVEDDFDENELKMIEEAMADIANKSCLTFRPRKNNEHAVIIQGSENGCFSNVGFNIDEHQSEEEEETRQVLNLSERCFKYGTVVHEMLHTLGFYHMQSTYDRDDFVEILWENIKSGVEHNFAKYTIDTVTDFGVRYDYDSVMHYPATAFSKNGNKTIIPLKENVKIGQRKGMSESDVIKLNRMYCEDDESISYMV
ncbi:zinc metalloproteinase nas-13-like, partial [Nymphalis io]|uniref:zinc metalloproteinase nas-13-like n=1 Tax=Inachis io TaxID=171585 RepID=UPI00216A7A62